MIIASQDSIKLALLGSHFNLIEGGYFSGDIQYQSTAIPSDGLIIQCYVEFRRNKAISLVSDISAAYLGDADDIIHIPVSGHLDGSALPESFTLHYRVFSAWDSIEATPSLPASFGSYNISTSPKGLLGGKKWRCSGGNEVLSIIVHNDSGDFYVSSNILVRNMGGEQVGLVSEIFTDGVFDQFFIFDTPMLSIKDQYASGAEGIRCKYRFFKSGKWKEMNRYNSVFVERN